MSIEALLTVFGVVLAVIALIPEQRGHDLRIRLGGKVSLIGMLVALALVYWALLEQIHALPWVERAPRPIAWIRNWTPGTLSLLSLLLLTAMAWLQYERPLPMSRISRLGKAIADGIARRRFGECIHLLGAHLNSLRRASSGDYWREKLRIRFLPTNGELHLRALQASKSMAGRTAKSAPVSEAPSPRLGAEAVLTTRHPPALLVARRRGRVSEWFIARADEPQMAAKELLRTISLAPALVREIAAVHPYLGLQILQLPSTWVYRAFAETFAWELANDLDSVLYREVRRAENVGLNNVPEVDPLEQPLLAFLCSDGARPQGATVLPTFLELAVETIRMGQPTNPRDILNSPLVDYHTSGRWTSPPFVSLYLYRIVCPRLAVAPQAQLVNLYGLQSFVASLLGQLRPSAGVDPTDMWPTPTHYLIYQVVVLLRDLARMLQQQADLLKSVAEQRLATGNTSTLPEQAIYVLGSVMRYCLRSDRIDAQFKGALLDAWWYAYWEKYSDPWDRTNDVLEALARGSDNPKDVLFVEGIADALQHLDDIQARAKAAAKLRARVGLPPT
jgi:hypothetical protein